jgi:hypothetical protein
MPRFRSFDMGRAPTEDDRVTFELTGDYTARPGERWTETFTTVGMAPAGVLESLTSAITLDPLTGRRRYSTVNCMSFVRSVLIPEDRQRFEALCEDVDRLVGLIDLVQVVAWLSDELTLRPTPPLSVSTAGGEQRDGEVTPVAAAT